MVQIPRGRNVASEELLRSWAVTESHLEAAYALLPPEAIAF
jgi:hypothetical protein